jgi:major vault protein
VEVGPTNILLDFDEELETLTLSTGKPKTTDTLLNTVFLRVLNNKISDIVDVETSDHIQAVLKLSFIVNFEGPSTKWFDVENYVKFLCDHVRSMLKGVLNKKTVEQFYSHYLELVRDSILGPKPEGGGERPGMAFPQNGMRIVDVEVLDMQLKDKEIEKILVDSQHLVVRQNINLSKEMKQLEVTKATEEIRRQTSKELAATTKLNCELAVEEFLIKLDVSLAQIEADLRSAEEKTKLEKASQALADLKVTAELVRKKNQAAFEQDIATNQQKIALEKLSAETEAAVKRLEAARDGFVEALTVLGRQDLMVKVSEATNIERFITGNTMESALTRLFAGIPFMGQTWEKAIAAANGNGNGSSSQQRIVVPTKE